jgi:hypothetical protein
VVYFKLERYYHQVDESCAFSTNRVNKMFYFVYFGGGGRAGQTARGVFATIHGDDIYSNNKNKY